MRARSLVVRGRNVNPNLIDCMCSVHAVLAEVWTGGPWAWSLTGKRSGRQHREARPGPDRATESSKVLCRVVLGSAARIDVRIEI